MIYTTMWTYPWDVIDEGADRVVGIFREEMGLDAMSLSTAYHTYDALRTHLPGKKIYSGYEDAIYFQPQIELYRNTGIKPNVHPIAKDRNILKIISEACDAGGLDLISWTVSMHTHYLARQYPDAAILGVFGDRYPGSLCPGDRQVREYIRALSLDLDTNYNLKMIEYEALYYMGYGMFRNYPKIGVNLGQVGSFLMSLCFCEGCTARAEERGIDVEALKVKAEELLLDCFENGPVGNDVEEFVRNEPLAKAYVEMRADTVTTLVQEMRETVNVPISFIYMGSYLGSGLDRKAIEKITDRSNALFYGTSADGVRDGVRGRAEIMDDPSMLIAGLISSGGIDSAEHMKEILLAAYEGGARRFSYYNYGMTPVRNFRWIGGAIEAVRALDARE